MARLYGEHPWHWYMTEGLTVLMGPLPYAASLYGIFIALKQLFKSFARAAAEGKKKPVSPRGFSSRFSGWFVSTQSHAAAFFSVHPFLLPTLFTIFVTSLSAHKEYRCVYQAIEFVAFSVN